MPLWVGLRYLESFFSLLPRYFYFSTSDQLSFTLPFFFFLFDSCSRFIVYLHGQDRTQYDVWDIKETKRQADIFASYLDGYDGWSIWCYPPLLTRRFLLLR